MGRVADSAGGPDASSATLGQGGGGKFPKVVIRLGFASISERAEARAALQALLAWDELQQIVIGAQAHSAAELREQLGSFTKRHVESVEEVPVFMDKIGAKRLVTFQRGAAGSALPQWDECLCYVIAGSALGCHKGNVVERFDAHHIIGIDSYINQGHSMVHHREFDALVAGQRGVLLAKVSFQSLTLCLQGDTQRSAFFWEHVARYLAKQVAVLEELSSGRQHRPAEAAAAS